MAALKGDSVSCDAKSASAATSPLARVGREFAELVRSFETGLLRSLDDVAASAHKDHVRREACRLAVAELSIRYTRKYIRRSLDQAECEGKRVEEQLHLHAPTPTSNGEHLGSLFNGHFRLFSTELFDLLGQPTELRLGTLRFHRRSPGAHDIPGAHPPQSPWVTVELALNHSFFVADSHETLPYHNFRLPTVPSLQNRGILSRKPQDCGVFPDYDSWLLFTFLGNGSIKLEVPIEMCADVYGGRLRGRENQEVLFWGFFVDDHVE